MRTLEDIVQRIVKFLNMQNIPSHALDIRHMFRATPEQTETIKCESNDDEIKLTLSLYDSVPTPDGKAEVKNLKQNDIVIFKEDKTEIRYFVSDIKVNCGKATLIFRREDAQVE